ncbi:glycosyltransferase [Urechidicola croceus]|uniref:Glycosyl transferase family 2 n=1 Tax=Urechidicola croceus TaxID=1850246 RepID=A0A1D8P603_9FLAO|nr:glycosyltransferase [Urechidicola croceus]AOW20028.1 glycosyl transferase family 2 [Urechidicola croceus]
MNIVFYVFLCVSLIQLFYFLFVFAKFSFINPNDNISQFPPISLLICARNEAENLEEFLPFFIEQKYPNFELVLINHASIDNTLDVIESFKKRYPKLIKIVNVAENEQFWGTKKYALTLGIKAATHESLVFSDADCKPASNNWLLEMSKQFNKKNTIVLGYGGYQKIKNSFLNKLIRFETLFTAIQYFSYAKLGIPYMGVGRNLGYTKTQFFKTNGFASHMKIRSGDDDLFVNQSANKYNTAICFTKDSFTVSVAKTTFKNWILQKRRHISTATYYKPIHKFLLGLFYVSQLLFWLLAIMLLLIQFKWIFVISIMTLRILVQYITIHQSAKKLNEKDLVFWSPFLEIFLIFIQLFIFIKNLFSKPTHW